MIFGEKIFRALGELRAAEVDDDDTDISHHGIKGQQWGVRNGPPYPLNSHQRISKKSYEKLNDIYKSMPLSDRRLIDPDTNDGDGYFSSYHEYKKQVAYNGLADDGFIIAEKISSEDNVDGTRGVEIGIGVISKGKGTGTRLVDDMKTWFNNQDEYDSMWWPVDKNNKASIALARKAGFIKDPYGSNYIYGKKEAMKKLGIPPKNTEMLPNYFGHAYFISSNDSLTELDPRVPDNFFTRNGYEDSNTPRISFAPSIDKCLAGLSQNVDGQTFSVYEPNDISKHTVYKPNTKAVPDSGITDELWICENVPLKKSGTITVTGNRGEAGRIFSYGDQQAELFDDWTYESNPIKHDASTLFGERVTSNDIYYMEIREKLNPGIRITRYYPNN